MDLGTGWSLEAKGINVDVLKYKLGGQGQNLLGLSLSEKSLGNIPYSIGTFSRYKLGFVQNIRTNVFATTYQTRPTRINTVNGLSLTFMWIWYKASMFSKISGSQKWDSWGLTSTPTYLSQHSPRFNRQTNKQQEQSFFQTPDYCVLNSSLPNICWSWRQ